MIILNAERDSETKIAVCGLIRVVTIATTVLVSSIRQLTSRAPTNKFHERNQWLLYSASTANGHSRHQTVVMMLFGEVL